MADRYDDVQTDSGDRSPIGGADTFEEAPESAPSPTIPDTPSAAADNTQAGPNTAVADHEVDPSKNDATDSARGHLRSRSRQNTLDTAPQLLPQSLPRQQISRERSTSPTKRVAALSGQERQIGERPPLTSPEMSRKSSSGFAGLLGRMGSMRRSAKSPPATRQEGMFVKRGTATSVEVTGNSLAAIADWPENGERAAKPSLQDRFQNLRKQEEHSGIPGANGHYVEPEIGDASMGHARKTSNASVTTPQSPVKTRGDSVSSVKSPPVDPALPPGTASGMTAGPAEEPRPVDWDLWQTLVMEGPTAVTKTSGEELNRAIASGIPAAIRGVVWQVLAESKNEELEALYYTLKNKGSDDADAPVGKPAPASRSESQNNLAEGKESIEKLSKASSDDGSSRSGASTPPVSHLASPTALAQGEDAEVRAKLLAEKQKRDSAALAKLEKTIRRDMGSRTSFSKYTQSAGLQDGLFGVCKAYALFDEGVGYAQGINFIAMPLLFNMDEGEAFALLVRLMSKYDVRSLFMGDMTGLHLRLYQFERLLEDHEPAIYCHLKRRNVAPQLYATQWFLTMFAYRFPLQLVLRVYDLVFSEGLTAILKFGIVLLRRNREALLEMKDMSQLTSFLKEKVFDVYIDKSPSASSLLDSGFFGSVTGGADKELYRADEMVRDACEVSIPKATLAAYTHEWEEQQRATQESEAELEHLRASHAALTAQVKTLEERSQQQDAEHVQLAGDLVRVKVENDALHDEIEGLKLRNEELQRLVDTQPAEVEEKLNAEMQRIMQRNIEVQNENRALKEEMDETERALVETKMSHAQTQADHDALKKRWASVQAMLNS